MRNAGRGTWLKKMNVERKFGGRVEVEKSRMQEMRAVVSRLVPPFS